MKGPPAVLIVDDDPEIRVGLRYYLQERGFHALVAQDGREALQIVREEADLKVIVLDLRMPGKGGLTFLHELKDLNELKGKQIQPNVIVVTALTGDTVEKAVAYYGVTKILAKPVPLSIIEKAIQEALA